MTRSRHALTSLFAITVLAVGGFASPAAASEWFVAAGMSGDGSSAAPFGRIQDGLGAAQPGDTITVGAGTYAEALRTVRSGTSTLPIRLRAAGARGSTIVTIKSTVLRVDHAYLVVEGLVLDGQYAAADTVDVNGGANYLVLRNLEIRRSTKDLIDMDNPRGVLIEGCLIHHALNAANGRTDAHGVVAGAVQDLTVRNTEIHTFSGDGLQVDPGRAVPGWNASRSGSRSGWRRSRPPRTVSRGVVPGENAVDTKANAGAARATIVIRDTVAHGFRGGLISNMAAFNIKENVSATIDRVTVYDSEIAFRLRGPASTTPGAWVTVTNAVVYNALTAFRYEDNIEQVRIWNSTLGRGITRAFQAASSSAIGLQVRNLLILGTKPAEAAHTSNLAVGPEAFADANANDYQLAVGIARHRRGRRARRGHDRQAWRAASPGVRLRRRRVRAADRPGGRHRRTCLAGDCGRRGLAARRGCDGGRRVAHVASRCGRRAPVAAAGGAGELLRCRRAGRGEPQGTGSGFAGARTPIRPPTIRSSSSSPAWWTSTDGRSGRSERRWPPSCR